MKYVNDAFTSYSPQPREGEQLGPGFPPLSNCSRLVGRNMIDRIREIQLLQAGGEGGGG